MGSGRWSHVPNPPRAGRLWHHRSTDERVVDTVDRALGVCYWTGGALSPFGGDVYALWGLRVPSSGDGAARAIPGDGSLASAIEGNRL